MSIIEDLIPEDLNMTTSERLLLVADIIESEPKHWDQGQFAYGPRTLSVGAANDLAGTTTHYVDCGTTFCVGGWGVATTPANSICGDASWEEAGAVAFGFTDKLADVVFYDMETRSAAMAEKLRLLATVPEPRTLIGAINAGYEVAE